MGNDLSGFTFATRRSGHGDALWQTALILRNQEHGTAQNNAVEQHGRKQHSPLIARHSRMSASSTLLHVVSPSFEQQTRHGGRVKIIIDRAIDLFPMGTNEQSRHT